MPTIIYEICFCSNIEYSRENKLLLCDEGGRFSNYLYKEFDESEIEMLDKYLYSIKNNNSICIDYNIQSDGFVIENNTDKWYVFYDNIREIDLICFNGVYYKCESEKLLNFLKREKGLGYLYYDFIKPFNDNNMTFLFDRHYKSGMTCEDYVEYGKYNLSIISDKISEEDIVKKANDFVTPYKIYNDFKVYKDNKKKMFMVCLFDSDTLDGGIKLFYTFDGEIIGADFTWCSYLIQS